MGTVAVQSRIFYSKFNNGLLVMFRFWWIFFYELQIFDRKNYKTLKYYNLFYISYKMYMVIRYNGAICLVSLQTWYKYWKEIYFNDNWTLVRHCTTVRQYASILWSEGYYMHSFFPPFCWGKIDFRKKAAWGEKVVKWMWENFVWWFLSKNV